MKDRVRETDSCGCLLYAYLRFRWWVVGAAGRRAALHCVARPFGVCSLRGPCGRGRLCYCQRDVGALGVGD